MNDGYVSRSCIIASTLWGAVVLLLAGAWWFGLRADQPLVAQLLAATACATSAVAATAHIRCYAIRVMNLVRVTAGLESPRTLRPVGERDL